MYIQICVKGIPGSHNGSNGLTWDDAIGLVETHQGIVSNLWRNNGMLTPRKVADVLTDENLDHHLHRYAKYGPNTPFISLACGSVERRPEFQENLVRSAIDTALGFATSDWLHPGTLFYLWVPIGHHKTVPLSAFSEPVRDLNIYQRWSEYQLEGEITAKIHIPSNQIEKIEWWDGSVSQSTPVNTMPNPHYVKPDSLSNIRDFF